MPNLVSAELSDENRKRALELIAELKSLFPFGVTISNEEKKTMPKMDDGRQPFVEKALMYGKQEPSIVPPYVDINELSKDFVLNKSMSEIEKAINSLAELISDTRVVAGSEAYVAALSIYNSAKGASKSGISGARTIVDDLKKLFENQGRKESAAASAEVKAD